MLSPRLLQGLLESRRGIVIWELSDAISQYFRTVATCNLQNKISRTMNRTATTVNDVEVGFRRLQAQVLRGGVGGGDDKEEEEVGDDNKRL